LDVKSRTSLEQRTNGDVSVDMDASIYLLAAADTCLRCCHRAWISSWGIEHPTRWRYRT